VITLSVISVANSCTFASTRTIQALCAKGMGPSVFAKVDKKGRPWVVLIVVLLFGCLAYINESPKGSTIFTWLLSLSGLSNFFTWGSICFAHIQFRKAWAKAGRTTDDLPFAAMFGTIGSWIGLALNILCLIAQFYVALFPIGGTPTLGAEYFFESYLAAPVVILFFVGYKVWYKEWKFGVNVEELVATIDEGRREIDIDAFRAEMDEERRVLAAMPAWKRVWNFWF